MDSLAAAPYLVDFDSDGDLDLLVGNIAGRVILIRNDGTAKEPKFTKERTALQAGGAPIEVPGGDAGPTVADWDGDGRWDLIVGAGDGSVRLYRNVGAKGKPAFAKGRTLIAAGERGFQPIAHGVEPTGQGARVKVCAVDFDGDGHLDLLVGDFASVNTPEPELTEEQIATRDRLRKQQEELGGKMSALYQELKDEPEKLREAQQELSKGFTEIYRKLRPLEAQQEPHGWVWFFKRKPAPEPDAPDGAN